MQRFYRSCTNSGVVVIPYVLEFREMELVFAVGDVTDVFDKVLEYLVDNFRFKHFLDNVPGDVELFAHFSNLVVDENLRSLRNGIAQLAKNFIVVFWRVKQDAGEDHGQNGLAELVP